MTFFFFFFFFFAFQFLGVGGPPPPWTRACMETFFLYMETFFSILRALFSFGGDFCGLDLHAPPYKNFGECPC